MVTGLLGALFTLAFVREPFVDINTTSVSPWVVFVTLIALLLLLGLPLYGLCRLLLAKKSLKTTTKLLLIALWILSLCSLIPLTRKYRLIDHDGIHIQLPVSPYFNGKNSIHLKLPFGSLSIDDLDNIPGVDYHMEKTWESTYTEEDGTVTKVVHSTRKTRNGVEERIDTIRTPPILP